MLYGFGFVVVAILFLAFAAVVALHVFRVLPRTTASSLALYLLVQFPEYGTAFSTQETPLYVVPMIVIFIIMIVASLFIDSYVFQTHVKKLGFLKSIFYDKL